MESIPRGFFRPIPFRVNNSIKPGRGLIQNSTFKRGGLFKRVRGLFKSQENTLQKDLRNVLEY